MQGQILTGKFHKRSRFEGLQGDRISFGAALQVYWDEEGSLLKGKAYLSYHHGWKENFGGRELVRFAVSGVADIEVWLKKIQAASSTVNAHRWCEYGLRFFNWAITRRRWVKENPCELVNEKIIGKGKGPEARHAHASPMEQKLLDVALRLDDWAFIRL